LIGGLFDYTDNSNRIQLTHPAWEFKYYAPAAPLSLASVEGSAAKYAADGWVYAGALSLPRVSPDDVKRIEFADDAARKQTVLGAAVNVLVFRRPAAGRNDAKLALERTALADDVQLLDLTTRIELLRGSTPPTGPEQALEAQIIDLQKKLADLRAKKKKTVVLTRDDLGPNTDPASMMTILKTLSAVRYGAEEWGQRLSFSQVKAGTTGTSGLLTIEGDSAAVDWVVGVAKTLKAQVVNPPQPAGPSK
jgi:hypothetical protein